MLMPRSTSFQKSAFRLAVLAAVTVLAAYSFAALPEMRVATLNKAAINSTSANRSGAGNCQSTNTFSHKYVAMALTLTDAATPANNITVTSYKDSIRGRGNSTWNVSKKPYRIKFGDGKSMFGSKKHKSWALLANWYDPTFALNAVAFELGRRLGLPGTPGYYFVDLYLNDEYKGIYQLTDLVQVNKGRVEVDTAAGWLAEFDYHCPSDADEIDFNTNNPPNKARLHTYIKSPEDLPSQSGYQFVKDQLNALTDAMFQKSGFPENGYRDLVDLESFAKYIMVQQFMDNFDFVNKTDTNMLASNFVHKDKGKRIVGGPLWDLDLAAGVEMTNFPKHYQKYDNPIKPKHLFWAKFFSDPVFLAKWKKNWDKHKNDFRAMTGVMDSIARMVEGSVVKNFAPFVPAPCTGGWGCGGFGMMTPNTPESVDAYKSEVSQLKTWWDNRMTHFEQQINNMNIDVSKDVIQTDPTPTPAAYTLTTNATPSNYGRIEIASDKPASNGKYESGTVVTLKAVANSGYKFSAWSGSGVTGTVTADSVKVTMNADKSVTATFTAATSVAHRYGTAVSGMSVVRNGLSISAVGSASLEVVSLTGAVVRSQAFSAGRHAVGLGDLPRGMYMVRVDLDGVKRTVRVAVR